ncbi:hypothetical protein MHC_01280 [Mycoplasma haemocanis str. Illinois]|uniref:Uncharacterized protein n=1 Tax=Mycoplasma haemocanis (strain Illinois) TaxID=1111676 RepID=H6N650_MYCHN|nr:hypothetical protein [Mycoplasma haemocanis]AEW45122.1 hypothetical protein MHC_01280 [Mycoplasma haemocanis str. Illinois]
MNPLVLKGVAGALSLTAVAGIVKLSIGSSRIPQPISLLLEKHRPDKRLLFKARKGSDPDWKSAWQRYLSAYSGLDKNPFSVNLSSSGNGDAPNEFMDGCEALFKEKVLSIDDYKYEQVLEYCTRDTLVSDFAWEEGKQLADNGSWNDLWKKYYTSGDDFWNLKNGSYNEGNMNGEFKDKCSKEFNVKTGNPKHPSVTRAITYCSKDRPKEQS